MKRRLRVPALLLLATSGGGLSAQEPPVCRSAAHRTAAPLVGVWREYTVTDSAEVYEGELTSTLDAGGCAFVQTFVSADGTFTFRSLGFVDPTTGGWRERFVLSNGATAEYHWKRDGSDLLLERAAPGGTVYRLRVTDLTLESYVVIEERLDGETGRWRQGQRTVTRRTGGG